MSICLSHSSALAAWRRVRYECGVSPSCQRASVPSKVDLDAAGWLREQEWAHGKAFDPLHVQVSSQNGKTHRSCIASHCPPIEKMRLVRIDAVVLAPRIEAVYLQLATVLPLEQLVLLAFEICGTYSLSVDGTTFAKARPASSVEKLTEFAASHASVRGSSKALKALRSVADGAASPAESRLVALLCMKQTFGGYGFPLPQLNHAVDVSAAARSITPRKYFVLDLYWERARLDVEYDSDAFHASGSGIASDAGRRNALQSMGFTVVTVTREQMASPDLFDDVARVIAKALGIRVRHTCKRWPERRSELRRNLFGRSGIVR